MLSRTLDFDAEAVVLHEEVDHFGVSSWKHPHVDGRGVEGSRYLIPSPTRSDLIVFLSTNFKLVKADVLLTLQKG